MDELVDAFVLETFQEGVGVTQHVTRIAHAEAHLVVSRNFVENLRHKFGEVCSCIESVAAAVLPCQLDFDAAVCNEAFDLLHDICGRVAVQAAFYESRGTVGAGIETTFLNVHDTHHRRFPENSCHSGATEWRRNPEMISLMDPLPYRATHSRVEDDFGRIVIPLLQQFLQTCECYFV